MCWKVKAHSVGFGLRGPLGGSADGRSSLPTSAAMVHYYQVYYPLLFCPSICSNTCIYRIYGSFGLLLCQPPYRGTAKRG